MVESVRPDAARPQSPSRPPAPLPGSAPAGLDRVARLGHQLLQGPVEIVAVSPAGSALLAAAPDERGNVPLAVARRLADADGVLTLPGPGGTTWSGAAAGTRGTGIRVTVCVPRTLEDDAHRSALGDLAELAADTLRLQSSREDVAALRELIGTASHDLRTPLSVLRAGLETLTIHGDELPDGQRERIADLAVRQARRMHGMLDGLLSLHGLEDESDHEQEAVDLSTLVRDALEAGRLTHDLAELQLAGPLPTGPVVVRGVTDSLARVLTNLVSNAAVHGGGRVWLGLEVAGDTAVVTVADDGPGMPDDTPLTTGERAPRDGGHGLGLLITRRIVANHLGSIRQRPRGGGGTVIELRLPLAPSEPLRR